MKKNDTQVFGPNPTYDPIRDQRAVDQTGFVDLAKANSLGSVPANMVGAELSYNGIEDPNSIGFRPADVFEATQAAKATVDYVPPKKEE